MSHADPSKESETLADSEPHTDVNLLVGHLPFNTPRRPVTCVDDLLHPVGATMHPEMAALPPPERHIVTRE